MSGIKIELLKVLVAAVASIGACYVSGKMIERIEKEPSMEQWKNRLIEHFEPEHLSIAYDRFLFLVESGLVPAHAFDVVVKT